MALPTSYLTTVKNLAGILDALKSAKAPDKFTHTFLESLEYKSSSDRLIIGVLKALGFIDDSGKPTDRYFNFLDQTQSGKVLAEGIEHAYADLFRVNVSAHQLTKQEVINKFKTLSQGKIGDAVLEKMALTFMNLVKLADFSGPRDQSKSGSQESPADREKENHQHEEEHQDGKRLKFGGLVYNIQIVLPESRDQAVYDALFQSLRKHLM